MDGIEGVDATKELSDAPIPTYTYVIVYGTLIGSVILSIGVYYASSSVSPVSDGGPGLARSPSMLSPSRCMTPAPSAAPLSDKQFGFDGVKAALRLSAQRPPAGRATPPSWSAAASRRARARGRGRRGLQIGAQRAVFGVAWRFCARRPRRLRGRAARRRARGGHSPSGSRRSASCRALNMMMYSLWTAPPLGGRRDDRGGRLRLKPVAVEESTDPEEQRDARRCRHLPASGVACLTRRFARTNSQRCAERDR